MSDWDLEEIKEFSVNIKNYTVLLQYTFEDGPEMILYKHDEPDNRIHMFGPELEELVKNVNKIL